MTPKLTPQDSSGLKKRKGMRFRPDPGTAAFLDLRPEASKDQFRPQDFALVINESHRGCSLVLKTNPAIRNGARLYVKVGKLAPHYAEVKWRLDYDSEVTRVGLLFLEK